MGELIDLDNYRKERGYWFKEAAESELRLEALRAELNAEMARRAFCLTKIGLLPEVELE